MMAWSLQVIKASGTDLARDTQSIYMQKGEEPQAEKQAEIARKVEAWKATNDLQIPDFDEEHIKYIRGTIEYPPQGSSHHKDKNVKNS